MIHPYEVAHRNYLLWEHTVDAILRAHNWAGSPSCQVPLHVQPESLEPVLDRYRDGGWHIEFQGNTYTFTMPPHLVLDI